MTALVACFGLLPAAIHGHRQRFAKPFAIVIVAGLASRLLLSIFFHRCYSLAARGSAIPYRFDQMRIVMRTDSDRRHPGRYRRLRAGFAQTALNWNR